MILDQPTVGVDVGAKAELYEQIDQLSKTGVTILLVTDDLEELLNLSERNYPGTLRQFDSLDSAGTEIWSPKFCPTAWNPHASCRRRRTQNGRPGTGGCASETAQAAAIKVPCGKLPKPAPPETPIGIKPGTTGFLHLGRLVVTNGERSSGLPIRCDAVGHRPNLCNFRNRG